MKKTLTLPESEIIALANVAKGHGTVALAKLIGIGKSQLYQILRGHNRVTPETADKISTWLSTDALPPEQPQQHSSKSRNLADRPTKSDTHNPRIYTLPSKPAINWNDPEFLEIAVIELCKAIRDERLRNVTILLGGSCKCGD